MFKFILPLLLIFTSIANAGYDTGTADQVYRIPHAGGRALFGNFDLSKTAAVGSTILGSANGGFGLSTSASTGVPSVSSGTWSIASTLGSPLGGTGLASPTANSILMTNGSSAYQTIAPGISGNVMVSTGTTWNSSSLASTYKSPNLFFFKANGGAANYVFTVTSANATVGSTFTNNTQTFTVLGTIAGGTTLLASGTGTPLTSGTLTKASGTGDSTITFSAESNAYIPSTNPAPLYVEIEGVGAGGGGGGTSGTGGTGGNTTMGSVLTCTGGTGGGSDAAGGLPGACTFNAPLVGMPYPGGHGGGFTYPGGANTSGGIGGVTIYGGNGGGGVNTGVGTDGGANTGAGGGGASTSATSYSGSGGGSGGGFKGVIPGTGLATSYAISIGAGGTSGSSNGGLGGTGGLTIREHFQ